MVRLKTFKTGVAVSVLTLLAVSASAVPTATPAAARIDVSVGLNFGGVGFRYFHQNLYRRGHWINHPIWGDVWVPPRSRNFRPYSNGYWVYSDYGLLWIGYDPWSEITDHYGRWVWDPYYRWIWIPGYVWGPGWVIWRTGGGYFGWMPMPPDYGDYYDGPYFGGRYGWDDYYGYGDWYDLSGDAFFGLWIFVDDNHFYRRDYRNYAVSDGWRVRSIINKTTNATNYVVQGDKIVNRSISADRLERITHQRIQPVEARRILKSDVPMATVRGGRAHARQEGSGESGPHFHDHNFQPLKVRGGQGEGTVAPLIQHEPKRNMLGRGRGGENEATPSTQPQPNMDEGRARGRNRGDENEAMPSTQPQPNMDEGRARGRYRGSENEAMPSTQPQPNMDEGRARGRYRGSENEAMPSTQPQPNMDEGRARGRYRGGENEAMPSPQPQPNADEGRGRGRNRGGNAEGQTQGVAPGAEQGPDKEKKKKRNREDTGPNDNGPD